MPAGEGGWRTGSSKPYPRLTDAVVEAHLTGEIHFEGPVRAETARTIGSGLVREAIALRGRMDLAGYDRLFPAPARR